MAGATVRRKGGVAIVRVPSNGGRVRKGARRVATAGLAAARDERHTLIAIAAAGGLGWLQRTQTTIPHVRSIGVPASLGIAAYAGAKLTKSKILRHVATGMLCVAAYQWASEASPAAAGLYGDEIE